MRTRLLAVMLVGLTLFLVAIGIRLGISYAESEQRDMYLDRLNDTARLASIAESGFDAGDPTSIAADLDRLYDVFGIRSALLDKGGTVLAASAVPPPLDADYVRRSIDGAAAGIREGDSDLILPWDARRLIVAEPVELNGDVVGVVVTASPTDELHRRVLRDWIIIGLAGLGTMVVLGAATVLFARWVLRPVRALDESAHEIATGRLGSRVARSTGPPELRRLATSFNEMADTVETSLEQQRAFVADASHQLRNPLNALLLRLQYLQLVEPEQLPEALREAETEGWRLTRLVDELLALATGEHPSGPVEPFRLDLLVRERVDAWTPAADGSSIALQLSTGEPVSVVADRTNIQRALDEVLGNAIKYTPANGTVTIGWADEGSQATVVVTDSGPGIADEELDLVTNRFWRGPQHQNVPGFGLGLSIAATLLAATGARIEFSPAEPSGLTVRLTLPRNETAATGR